tara:strand:+ start:1052 stop:1840 length:789 start_codon:yes stop_codon:yes gene_type:complete
MIGLFFGNTEFPKLILQNIKKKKKNYFIIDLSKNNKFKKDLHSYRVSIGQFGKILKLIREKRCKKVIFAGKINKPRFSQLKLDMTGIYYIPRIVKASKKGDAAILKELIKILSIEGVRVISSLYFNPDLSLSRGNYSKLKPDKNDLRDIRKGIKSLTNSNAYDHTQAAIVRNNIVVKETSKGTRRLIKSIKKIKKNNGILIKFPKKKQDLRADLPTVGLDTFKDCKKAGLKGIVLKSKQNVFLNKSKCISFANKNKMFIIVK